MELPDRPGALAKVAAVIAGHGGNVVGIDVQEVDNNDQAEASDDDQQAENDDDQQAENDDQSGDDQSGDDGASSAPASGSGDSGSGITLRSYEAFDLSLPNFANGNLAQYMKTLGTSTVRIGGNTVDETFWTSNLGRRRLTSADDRPTLDRSDMIAE